MKSAPSGHAAYTPKRFNGNVRADVCPLQGASMRKFIYPALIVAGLTAAGSVLAQASGLDTQPGGNAGPSFGPPVGTPEYYNNSGATALEGRPHYPYTVPAPRAFGRDSAAIRRDREREREIAALREREMALRREREIALQRERERDFDARRDRRWDRTMGGPRDRDGDGIANRRDRFPDDPYRY